ncbi:MAG: hypothetical protein WC545_03970 [Patescibacteria group bacterium]
MSKKQIIQLVVLTFFLYLGVFFMKDSEYFEYYDIYGLMTLIILSGSYVVYSKQDNKFTEYFRIFLYAILAVLIYIFLDNNVFFSSYHFYTEVMSYKPLEALYIIFTGFDFIYVLMISALLLFNKPKKYKEFKLGFFTIKI